MQRIKVLGYHLLLSLILPMLTQAQSANPTYSNYSGQSQLVGTQSVTLTNGFNAASGSNLKVHIANDVVLTGALTANRNYVLTTTYLKPFSSSVAEPTSSQASRQVEYSDGFGRPSQVIALRASPSFKDVVSPIAYDANGRVSRQYLPYTTDVGDGGVFKTNAVTAQQAFYNATGQTGKPVISHAYAQTVFEASPLNRVLEQGTPGANWQPQSGSIPNSGHTVKTPTTLNTTNVVRYSVTLLATNAPTLVRDGNYGARQLYVGITKGENWKTTDGKAGTTEEYTDKDGRVVLRRTYNKSGSTVLTLSTYYVYDDLGRLTYVLPPGTDPDGTSIPSAATIASLGYRYWYDKQGRKIEQTLPGKGVEYFVYNKRHQLVASQDAGQRARHEWMVSKYDAHGRVVITGLWNNSNTAITRTALQTQVDGHATLWEGRNTSTATHGYTNAAWPTNISAYYLVNYYDTYNIPGLPSGYAYQAYGGNVKIAKAPGLPTGSKTWTSNSTATVLWAVTYYDIDAQVIQTHVGNHLGGKDVVSSTYDFTGKLATGRRVHTGSSSQTVTVTNSYSYDHAGRLVDVKQKTGADAEITLAHHTYNELGQLIDKKLHLKVGQTKYLQSVDYRYNARGWLTSVNDPNLAANNTLNKDDATSGADLYGMAIDYENAAVAPQYNGNIAGIRWKTKAASGMTPAPPQLGYRFGYDALGQLTTALSSTNGTWDGNHSEHIRYTNTGNIGRIGRWARTGNAERQIDSLVFTYSGYRHTRIDDISTQTATYKAMGFNDGVQQANEYTYDANGNAEKDLNKGITEIKYNVFNLPYEIVFTTNPVKKIEYLYDRTGKKLQRKYTNGSTVETTDYVDGISYEQNRLAYVYTGEGRARRNGTTNNYFYEYALTDHLGSTRVIFDADPSDDNQTTARVIQQTAYYPYGMAMYGDPANGLHLSFVPGEKNNYLYSGKELQDQGGLNWYDHGARMYDPAIGRWNVMDPASQFSNPYLAMGNNPMVYIDPDGEWVHIVVGAAIGGVVNTITHWDEVAKGGFWEGVKAFGVGAVAGGLGAATGGAAAGALGLSTASVGGGIAMGSVGAVYNDMALGVGNMVAFGEWYEPSLERMGTTALLGGITGGAVVGGSNLIRGANFWTGVRATSSVSHMVKDGIVNHQGNLISNSGKVYVNDASKAGTNLVYQGFDKAGVVRYVGITGRDASVRFGEHLSSGTARSLLRYEVVPGATNLSRTGARVWEQGLINQYGLQKNGGLLLNKVNSIAPANWWQYGIK